MNEISTIYPLNSKQSLTYQQAQEIVPLLNAISRKTKQQLNLYQSQLAFTKEGSQQSHEIKNKINKSLELWSSKVQRLGVVPVSLCKAKILTDRGFFHWEYPADKISLFR